jgi:hypothetical protein
VPDGGRFLAVGVQVHGGDFAGVRGEDGGDERGLEVLGRTGRAADVGRGRLVPEYGLRLGLVVAVTGRAGGDDLPAAGLPAGLNGDQVRALATAVRLRGRGGGDAIEGAGGGDEELVGCQN